MERKILIIGRVHQVLEQKFKKASFICTHLKECSTEKLAAIIHEFEGLIVRTYPIGADVLDKAKKLKFIGRVGSGLDLIDLDSASKKNINVINSPGGNADAVAEHSIGFILNMLHNIQKGNLELRSGIYDRIGNSGTELSTLKIGIVGYGNVGSRLAQRLIGFGCEINVYDKYKSGFGEESIKEVALRDIYDTDILTFHVPYNQETHYYFDFQFLEKMKKPFYLLNTSRGKVVQADAVLKGLESDKIIKAALDVHENENFKASSKQQIAAYFDRFDPNRVILTPHVAGWSDASEFKMANILCEKILNFLS